MKRVRFHDLRHTCASLLLSRDVHPKIVYEQLGHSSLVIMLDRCSQTIKGMQARAAEVMEEVVGG